MKRTIKRKKVSKKSATATLVDMESPEYWEGKRQDYLGADGQPDHRYYEILETQIGALVNKLLYQTDKERLEENKRFRKWAKKNMSKKQFKKIFKEHNYA